MGSSSRLALHAARGDGQDGSVSRPGFDLQRYKAASTQQVAPGEMQRALFDKLDQNHDGVLTRSEFAQGFGPGPAGADGESGDRPSAGFAVHRMQELRKARSPAKEELRKGRSPGKEEHDLQLSYTQDPQNNTEQARSNLAGLAAERDRLQRQVHEMRGAVAETRRELSDQHEMQILQTTELRNTLASLQSDADSMQREQRRQAGSPQTFVGRAEVEGVLAKVESQEQRFARLENDLSSACAAQRAQLAEALQQGRQLAKGLEEEGARRANTVAELQQALQQGQRKDGLMASQLHQDLTRATQMIQGQSNDWSELARTIKSEVSGLANAMKADRDARAIETSSQRVELARMIDNARRANVCDSVETYLGGASSECGQDMMSRAGAVAVRKMVDTTKSLLHGLEEALILRAGFIAGVFHTWRCEATLWKVGRRYQEEFTRNQDEWEAHLQNHRQSFEEELRNAAEHHKSHRERVQMQKALLLDSWAYGEAVGLVRETMRYWRNYAVQEQNNRRTAARIHVAVLQWFEGQEKAFLHACFQSWKHWMLLEAEGRKRDSAVEDAERRHAEELAKVQKLADKRIQEGFASLEHMHKSAKKDLEVIIAKWEGGNRRGLLTSTFRNWQQFMQSCRRKARNSQAVQMQMHKFMEGTKRGVRHTCWCCWKNEVFTSKGIMAERKRFEQLLSGDRAERENERKRDLDDHKNMVEAAKEGVKLMVDKWIFGQSNGLKLEVFQVWAKWSLERAHVAKRCASVEMSLSKWVEGEARGDLHATFLHWKAHSLHATVVKRHQAALDSETQKMRSYLQDMEKKHAAELDYIKGEASRRKDAAHKTREYMILRWELGDRKGTLMQVVRCWHKAAKDCHRHGVQRAAVHQALLKSFEGSAKAAMQISFMYWLSSMKEARQEREHEDAIKKEQAHWEGMKAEMERLHDQALRGAKDRSEERRLKALALSESSLMKWMVGERKGLLRSVLLDWRRYKEAVQASRRKSKAVQAATLRFLEGEKRSAMQMAFTSWMNLTAMESGHLSRIDSLEKQVEGLIQRHEVKLAKYATMLGNEQEPLLMGWVFQMWKEISQGIKYLEQERATEVKLEEMRRQHEMQVARKRGMEFGTLRAFGMKDDQLLLWQIYEGWKAHVEKIKIEWTHKMNQKQVLNQYAESMIMQKFKKDDDALLASSFAEWHREALILKHERHQEEVNRKLEDHGLYATQMEQRIAGLEDQLMMAYRQIDHITDTLQKELQTKEELASELREAYDKMRQSCFTPTVRTPTTAVNTTAEGGAFSSWPSRPGSAQSRSGAHSAGSAAKPTRLLGSSNRDGLSSSQKFDQDLPPHDSIFDRGLGGFSSSLGATGQSADILRNSRTSSPSRCDWDVAVSRMRDEGLVRTERESNGRL